jgi:hypothetical protein
MGTKQLSMIAGLFRPEHSLQMSCEKCTPVPIIRPYRRAGLASIKALFWVAASIAAGLAIGQLH